MNILVAVVVIVVVVLLELPRVFNKTRGKTIDRIIIKPKTNMNASVRGKVEQPKHPFDG